MTTLTAQREFYSHNNCVLNLKGDNGIVVKQYTNVITQPRKGTKTVKIKGTEYLIDWGNCKRNR